MLFVILNETSNNNHYGCCAVSNGLRSYFQYRDDVRIFSIFNRQLKFNPFVNKFSDEQELFISEIISEADYFILNGEGSIHKNRSPEIEEFLRRVIDSGKRFCVVNSIYRDYPNITDVLSSAEFVTLRDEKSVKEAKLFGIAATRCADASLYANFSYWDPMSQGQNVCATDWHPEAESFVSECLSNYLADGASFFPFQRSKALSEWPEALKRLSSFNHIVCARYHGAIFSILAGRKTTLLPSNTDKIEELGRELGLEVSTSEDIKINNNVEHSRDYLLSMRNNQDLHPLALLELGEKQYTSHGALPKVGVFFRREPNETEVVRQYADSIKALSGRYSQVKDDIKAKLGDLSKENIHAIATVLKQEGCVKNCLILASVSLDAEQAYELYLELFNEYHCAENIVGFLGHSASALNQKHISSLLYETLEKRSEISDEQKLLAAGTEKSLNNFDKQLSYLQGIANFNPLYTCDAALAACQTGRFERAIEYARESALSHKIVGWKRMQMGIIIVFCGPFHEGMQLIREGYSQMEGKSKFCLAIGEGEKIPERSALYMPPENGIGSAALVSWALAGDLMLDKVFVDERLHNTFKGLNSDICFDVPENAKHHQGPVLSIYDYFSKKGRPENQNFRWSVNSSKYEYLKNKYDKKFGDAFKVGIAWSTPNVNSSFLRNWKLVELRNFLRRHSDVLFFSLQPYCNAAYRDSLYLDCENLIVDFDVDPIADVEMQLAQIELMDEVVTIDCSAVHFAGALGKNAKCVLGNHPTWMWPEKLSLYKSVEVVDSLERCEF